MLVCLGPGPQGIYRVRGSDTGFHLINLEVTWKKLNTAPPYDIIINQSYFKFTIKRPLHRQASIYINQSEDTKETHSHTSCAISQRLYD